jgi:hypothetical protein
MDNPQTLETQDARGRQTKHKNTTQKSTENEQQGPHKSYIYCKFIRGRNCSLVASIHRRFLFLCGPCCSFSLDLCVVFFLCFVCLPPTLREHSPTAFMGPLLLIFCYSTHQFVVIVLLSRQ